MAQSYVIRLNEDLKDEVARMIVRDSHPGGDGGLYGVTDGESVWEVSPTQSWDPYPDDRVTVRVRAFVDTQGNNFAGVPDTDEWEQAEDYAAWEAVYRAAHPDEADAPVYEVVNWARHAPQTAAQVATFEQDYEDAAVLFALSELAPAVRLDIDDEGYQDVVRLDA